MKGECKHHNFDASVAVARLEDTGQFNAAVRVHCSDCGRRFQFLGLEPGVDLQGARISFDALEANLAICPQGAIPSPLDNIAVNLGPIGRRVQ